MAWNDKPTAAQVRALTREYEALIYDLLDDAKESGNRALEITLHDIIYNEIVKKAIDLIPDRGEMTRAIASGNQHMHANVADYLEEFCCEHGVTIKLPR